MTGRTLALPREPIYYRTAGSYRGDAPFFYDVGHLEWARGLRAKWEAIRGEYERNVRRGSDHVVDVFNPAGPSVPGWRSVNFQTYLWRFHRACAAFPVTLEVLDSIPGLTSAYINVLEPHSTIPPHHGDSNTIMRCHLGLDVPAGDCGVRVGSETRRGTNGTLLAFSDAHEHTSWNATDARRVVLVLDVMLPEYRDRQRWICANVLAAVVVVWLEAHLRFLQRSKSLEIRRSGRTIPFPRLLRTALRRSIGLGFWAWLPIQRRARASLAVTAAARPG